jgi:predicted HTH transcriptional regulator
LLPSILRIFLPVGEAAQAAVLKVEFPRSLFVHRSPGGYFHRIGSSKREMSPEYLARLFQQRSQARIIRFDEQVVPTARLADLDQPLWQRFAGGRLVDDLPEVALRKLGLAREDDLQVWRPTVSGILMAAADPRRFLPNAFIQAVAYRGPGATPPDAVGAYQLDAADITGPLDAQVSEALRFVARNQRTAARKEIGRTDTPQFDLGAVFEALVNAVAHRDYAIYGSKIRLRLFSDRLEICSPGALANTMTVDSLLLRQSARNELLTSLLARCPVPGSLAGFQTERATMMDKRGEGVRIIFDRTEALAGQRPLYQLVDLEELQLIIPAASV